jgi:O-acetylserine/cysteine efflux transporter
MKPLDIFLAVAVAVTWGIGFVLSRLALDELSPALLNALRFTLAAIPCLFVRRPEISWPLLIAISMTLFFGQFLPHNYGIAHGVPVGLTSVIVQSQALFTVAFAVIFFAEVPTRRQLLGVAVAACGLVMICFTVGYDFSVGAFAVLMIAPVSFAIGNLLLRHAREVPMFDLFAWLSLVSALPLFATAFAVDGLGPTWHAVSHMSLTVFGCVAALGLLSTTMAYWIWGRLLRDYTAAQVVPFALLVPFIGAASGSLVFGERFGPLRLAGMIVVVLGIAIMLLTPRPRILPELA